MLNVACTVRERQCSALRRSQFLHWRFVRYFFSYQHGPHRYESHRLHLYGKSMACRMCWEANHDGWAVHVEPVLLAHLERQGLPTRERDEKGFLPRKYYNKSTMAA